MIKLKIMVRREGLEPSSLSAHAPQTCVYAIPPPSHMDQTYFFAGAGVGFNFSFPNGFSASGVVAGTKGATGFSLNGVGVAAAAGVSLITLLENSIVR